MGANQNGRVPIETILYFTGFRLRLYINDLTGLAVETDQVALLPFGVNDVGIGRIDGGLVAVAEQGDEPVAIANTVHIISTRRSALGEIILCAAINVIKRLIVINGHFVKLGHREIGKETVILSAVIGLVHTTVGAE